MKSITLKTSSGFAAMLLVITLSLSLMMAMVTLGDSTWLLKQNVISLGDRTERQLAAESCRQLALLYIAEDFDFLVKNESTSEFSAYDLGNGVSCTIASVTRVQSSYPLSDRFVETVGYYKNQSISMVGRVSLTNTGLFEKERYFK